MDNKGDGKMVGNFKVPDSAISTKPWTSFLQQREVHPHGVPHDDDATRSGQPPPSSGYPVGLIRAKASKGGSKQECNQINNKNKSNNNLWHKENRELFPL